MSTETDPSTAKLNKSPRPLIDTFIGALVLFVLGIMAMAVGGVFVGTLARVFYACMRVGWSVFGLLG